MLWNDHLPAGPSAPRPLPCWWMPNEPNRHASPTAGTAFQKALLPLHVAPCTIVRVLSSCMLCKLCKHAHVWNAMCTCHFKLMWVCVQQLCKMRVCICICVCNSRWDQHSCAAISATYYTLRITLTSGNASPNINECAGSQTHNNDHNKHHLPLWRGMTMHRIRLLITTHTWKLRAVKQTINQACQNTHTCWCGLASCPAAAQRGSAHDWPFPANQMSSRSKTNIALCRI
jgi:hypothetical protein